MKIYVAASWPRSEEAKALAAQLREAGHIVTSTWFDRKLALTGYEPDLERSDIQAQAEKDLVEVADSSAIVCITGDTLTKGGRHAEFGIAAALGLHLIILGPREQVFHHLPDVYAANDPEDVCAHLSVL